MTVPGMPIAPVLAQLPIVDDRGMATPTFLRILAAIGTVIQGPGGILDSLAATGGGGSGSESETGNANGANLSFLQSIMSQTNDLSTMAQQMQVQVNSLSQSAGSDSDFIAIPPTPAGYVPSILFNNGTRISSGMGVPNGVVWGSVGDLFLRQDGTAGSVLYVKESGNQTNTGWTAK